MATADAIAQKLKDALSPQDIKVEDVSHQHAGHAGWRDAEAKRQKDCPGTPGKSGGP